jgi:DUF1707 SHOCT-like domain
MPQGHADNGLAGVLRIVLVSRWPGLRRVKSVPPWDMPAGGSYGDSRQGGGRQPKAAMGAMAGGEEPAADIRVSDAERDAAAERLSAATGDGRLTLEEFSQRMELATTARTRADLDGLVADLPADAATAGSAASGPPSWHVSPVGGLKIRGPWRMDRHVIVVSLSAAPS